MIHPDYIVCVCQEKNNLNAKYCKKCGNVLASSSKIQSETLKITFTVFVKNDFRFYR